MKNTMPVKPMDSIMIFLALLLTGFSAYKAYIHPGGSLQVVIQGPGKEWVFPLDAEEILAVEGPLGHTLVRIHEGQAWVESSPCVNKTCTASGHVYKPGHWAACLPNNVFLKIEGSEDPPDAPDRVAW
jgi:hypothetical protein